MNNNQKSLSDTAAIAQFRLALIAPILHGLYPDASRNAYYRRVTQEPLTLPDGSVVQYSYKTLSKWVSLYQNGGIEALMPKDRSDKGSTRVLPDTAIEEIYRLKREFPRLNATQIHWHLVEGSFLPHTVSVCAVQRFIKHNDLKSAVSVSGNLPRHSSLSVIACSSGGSLDRSNPSYLSMFDMFHAWQQQAAKLENRKISREEYDKWRYTYPALDTSGHYVKVPSQELSDLLIKELDKESKKK